METIKIQNLKCGGCANTINHKIGSLDYVESIEVDLESSCIKVKMKAINMLSNLKKELSELGYPEEHEVNHLGKKAKSFVSCALGKISN